MLVTVANFTEPWEAHLFRGRLEAEGIVAFVAHELHVGNNWPFGLGLGGAKVQVHRDLAGEARAVERACIAGDYRGEIDALFGQAAERCPGCGAADFKSRPTIPKMMFVLVLFSFTGIPVPLVQRMRLCRACGTGWRRELAD